KVDAAWRPFRDAVRGLGRGRFDEPTSAGWTYRDLVAHVAAWEDRTARRIRAFHETGRQIGPEGEAALGIHDVRDTDGFNAKVASSHRLVGAEALVDELDTAHRRLTEEIARLTDDQLCADVEPTAWGPQSWVVAVVAGNSFGHYREHAEEMGIARSGEGPRG
ncbi:MAG TPA: maleylpyruvate isomerase N-terminal domain-containing protein, partial [Candidatus Limnocylindria bacterium]